MRASQVFTPTTFPQVTYIDDHLHEKARRLHDALEMGGSVISLSGPSKSGKTVFIEKYIGKERLIQVTGAGVSDSAMLWGRVFHILGVAIPKQASQTETVAESLGGKAAANVGVPGVFTFGGELNAGGSETRSASEHQEVPVDDLQTLIAHLAHTDRVVFIDDFHYISKEVQAGIAHQIKEAIRSGVRIVVASVPYHADDAIRANPDLRGRTTKLDFDYWKEEELVKIAERGFGILNVHAAPAHVTALACESAGSPQLMQALCLHSCLCHQIREVSHLPQLIGGSLDSLRAICEAVAATCDYSSCVAMMKDGPKIRGQNRKTHRLKDGTSCDVYPLTLRALAANPPELTFRYPNLQQRIEALCDGDTPSGSSVTGACEQIARIANDAEAMAVMEWDGDSDVLDIRDPYLLFYLRWAQ